MTKLHQIQKISDISQIYSGTHETLEMYQMQQINLLLHLHFFPF